MIVIVSPLFIIAFKVSSLRTTLMLKHIGFIAASPQAVELISFLNGLFLSSPRNTFKFEDCGAAFETDFLELSFSASFLLNKKHIIIYVLTLQFVCSKFY